MKGISKIYLVFLGIFFIGFLFYRSYLKRNPNEKELQEKVDVIDNLEDVVTYSPIEPISEHRGNQLENGSSPFSSIYGNGIYESTDHSLLIRNKGNSDVVVFLVERGTDKVIRNEYIQGNSSFEMTKIPNSTICYLKYYYGNNWNPTLKTKGKLTGGFDNGEQHIISDNESDMMQFKSEIRGDYIYSSNFEVTLETIIEEGNTLSEKRIDREDFF